MGLEYRFQDKQAGWSTDRHIIDLRSGDVKRLCQDCTDCDAGYFASKEPRPEVRVWLDRHTPNWDFFAFKVLHQFIFEHKDHAMLFKLTWA